MGYTQKSKWNEKMEQRRAGLKKAGEAPNDPLSTHAMMYSIAESLLDISDLLHDIAGSQRTRK